MFGISISRSRRKNGPPWNLKAEVADFLADHEARAVQVAAADAARADPADRMVRGQEAAAARGVNSAPDMFLAPGWLQQADKDKDNKVSEPEFNALAEKWFADWDKDKQGKLQLEQIRAG